MLIPWLHILSQNTKKTNSNNFHVGRSTHQILVETSTQHGAIYISIRIYWTSSLHEN